MSAEVESSGSILRSNDKRDQGWYRSANVLAHTWTRLIGPQAIVIYHLFKSMCRGNEETTYPQVRQQDWAAMLGMGLQPFQRALKLLLDAGLVDRILPQGEDRIKHKPTIYIINAAEDIPITPELLKRFDVKGFPPDCRFNDPILSSEQWAGNMYRKFSNKPNIKRAIREQFKKSEESNMSGDIESNMSLLNRQINTNTKNIFSKENISVPDGTHLINTSNSSLPQEGSFVSISKYPIEDFSVKTTSPMSQRIRQRTIIEIENSSHKGTQRKPLLPIDQMPKVLQVWFSLPLVTKPTNKTYHRIIRLLEQLKQGKFPTEYNLLNRDFTNPSAPGIPPITKQHVKKAWTEEELVQLLDTRLRLVIENAAYWPENKERSFKGMSFELFVFNPRSGRSKLLDLYVRRPQMLRRESEKILLKEDPYPEAMSVLSDVFDCIDKRRHPEQYAKATRHFSRIMEFLHALPGDSEAEWGLHGRINKGPFSIAHGIAQAFRDRYDRMRDPDPGMLKLDGKLIYAWLEEHNGEHFVYPGERRPRPLLLLHEEFLRHGRIRPPEEVAEDEPEVVKPDPQAERCRKEELWEQGEERRRKRQLIIDNLSPEDLSLIDSEADEVNVPKGKLSVQDEENSNTYIGFDDEGNPVRLSSR